MTERDDLRQRLTALGLTHEKAAELLGMERKALSRRLSGATKQIGELEYLVASWGVPSETQREAVRRRLSDLRGPTHSNAASGGRGSAFVGFASAQKFSFCAHNSFCHLH